MPARALVVGMSDQQPSNFSDARMRALGLKNARLIVPWDAATSQPAQVQAWLDAVRAAGMEPHVAFEHRHGDRCPSQPCTAPTQAQYAAAVRAFVAAFPQVRTYTTWNEANHTSQPVNDRPELVAGYYEELRAACPACTVVAGDVLDSGTFARWLERFQAATSQPAQLWGLHNYNDVTYGTTTGTDAMLAAVTGSVWIEETGGIVSLRNGSGRVALSADEARAARAVDNAFAIARARPRIARMYVYQWRAGSTDAFDAGLVRPDGTARASLLALAGDLAGLTPAVTAAPAVLPKWKAAWSGRRLVLRATCAAPGTGCRGRVNLRLRLSRKGRATVARSLGAPAFRIRPTATRVRLTIRVPASVRRLARSARRRTLVLTVRTATPAAARQTVRLRLRAPKS